ncbi:hypothetical protein [Parafrankia elaeagni]|uniref:hypothetical protein n=1 Tax=Parafrankia elaeagni TaxID=222534 RepID=UPI0003AA4A32|nr:hypothetical protein [Parafrankia elaeagni]
MANIAFRRRAANRRTELGQQRSGTQRRKTVIGGTPGLTTPDDVRAELGTAVDGWAVGLREMYEAPMSRPNGQVGFRVENALLLRRPGGPAGTGPAA